MPETTTQFAPARRSDADLLQVQRKLLAEYPASLRQLYDAISEIILIVNQDRQIVFFNSAVPSLLGVEDPEILYGMRPGEALGCTYACKNPGGCGTSEYCSQCGAVNAILSALSNKADLRECRVLERNKLDALDLLVRTTPLRIESYAFVIMAITDISHEKRRRALERIFFHDVMNTAAIIHLMADMLNNDPFGENAAAFRRDLYTGSKQLMEELCSQKELLAAENNELTVKMQTIDGCILVKDVVDVFSNRFANHKILLKAPRHAIPFKTDSGLLRRVLGNMILNAVEASKPEEAVTVSCSAVDGRVEFRVHNQAYIPKEVQLRLFQRSFSTKGAGRGLGTYSMKLLSERYLNGRIGLRSTPRDGTTFEACYRTCS